MFIKFIIVFLLVISDVFYGGFVFQFGWNHIVHEIGFPVINFTLAIGLSAFISISKSTGNWYKNESEVKPMEELLVYTFLRHTIALVIFWIIGLFI